MSRIKRTTARPSTFPAPVSHRPIGIKGVQTNATIGHRQTPAPAVQSPRRAVSFEFDVSGAWRVDLVGTFNNWTPGATPLVFQGGTKWTRTVPLEYGRHEYRFMVDGRWSDDPNARDYAPNPFGGMNAVVSV